MCTFPYISPQLLSDSFVMNVALCTIYGAERHIHTYPGGRARRECVVDGRSWGSCGGRERWPARERGLLGGGVAETRTSGVGRSARARRDGEARSHRTSAAG